MNPKILSQIEDLISKCEGAKSVDIPMVLSCSLEVKDKVKETGEVVTTIVTVICGSTEGSLNSYFGRVNDGTEIEGTE